MRDAMSYLEIQDLTKIYGKGATAVTALDHVSFTVDKGEFIAIVGASGSGKSTLLHMMGGVDTATSGSVKLQDEEVFSMKEERRAVFRRRRVGFVFQEYNLIPVLSVEENIKMPVRLDQKKMEDAYLNQLLEMLGLAERRKAMPDELSGGQKQRTAIARAMANNPDIILADEPTGALDSETSRSIMDLFHQLHQTQKKTIILITHSTDLSAETDRIITLKDGQIIDEKAGHNAH